MNIQKIITNSNKDKLTEVLRVRNFNNTNNFKKCESFKTHKLKKISLNSTKNQRNQNAYFLKKNNITENNLLEYKPKRLLKLSEKGKIQIPLSSIGGLYLDFDKTSSSDDKRNKVKSSINLNDSQKFINSNNDTEFKSTYFFKFAKNLKDFNKLTNYSELIDDNNDKRIFEDTFNNISKLIESHNKLYFNYIDLNTNNNNNLSVINNYEMPPAKTNQHLTKSNSDLINVIVNSNSSNNIINKYTNFNNSEISSTYSSSPNLNLNLNLKKLVVFWSNFIVLINKLLSQIFNDFSKCKKENTKLKKKAYRDELNLNNKVNELYDLKKYMNRFDVNLKINQQIQKEKEINELKKDFKQKENQYILLIYKLENDIKTLTVLLERNKQYYDQYKNISKEIIKNKKNSEILKIKFNKELKETNTKILSEREYQNELKMQSEELNEVINKKEEEIENAKNKNIELRAIIKKLETIIIEKKENILMLYQEFEHYMIKYNEEKSNLSSLEKEYKLLEQKFNKMVEEKKIEEKRRKEKKAKKYNKINENNENNENKGIGSLIPTHNKNDENFESPSPINVTQSNNN